MEAQWVVLWPHSSRAASLSPASCVVFVKFACSCEVFGYSSFPSKSKNTQIDGFPIIYVSVYYCRLVSPPRCPLHCALCFLGWTPAAPTLNKRFKKMASQVTKRDVNLHPKHSGITFRGITEHLWASMNLQYHQLPGGLHGLQTTLWEIKAQQWV